MDAPYTFGSRSGDGTYNGTDITEEQAADLAAGRGISYTPRNERVVVDDEGTIAFRADARPRYEDDSIC